MTPTAKAARQWGAIGALTVAARGTLNNAPGRAAFLANFDRYANPDAALRAHMRRLRMLQTAQGQPAAPTPRPDPRRYEVDRHGFRVLRPYAAEGAA